jgi:acetyl esterase/lipase
MVIVMIDAHAEALQPAGTVPRSDPDARAQNAELFERDLVEDLMPLIESHYRVASDRHGRALAGLSLGATLADVVGLSRRDLFASFGMFSGGGSPEFAQRHATLLSEPERTNREVDLLFLGTGRADPRPLAALTSLHQIFNERGVHHDFWTDSPEGHNWSVWRPLLAHGFLPRLFRGRTPTIVRHAYRQTAQRELELACYLPHDWRREDRRPAVVFFFGGGFWTWNVDQFAQQADYFARRGLVSILADYRTGEKDGTKPPAAFEDARAAMRWIRSHATQLGIDPHRVAASGGSAGGSLAASLVITNGLDAPGDDHTVSTRPDLLLLYNPGLPSAANARTVQRFGDEYTWRRTAAALHVGPDWPPSLLLYGSEDNLLTGGHALAEALHALRIRVELDVTAGVGHGFFNLPTHLAATTSRADRFFQELGWLQAGPFVPLPSGPASLSDSTSNPERGRQTDP